MDKNELIAGKLAELGVRLESEDLDELAIAYDTLLDWEETVRSTVEPAAEPVLVFDASDRSEPE
jgi:hypothetical protein